MRDEPGGPRERRCVQQRAPERQGAREAFRAFGQAGMDVLRQSERRAHNLLAAVRLRAITMAYVELCEV